MKIQLYLAIIICRVSRWILRRLGKGGTNVPGTLALIICPKILERLAQNVNVIIVTGTNGKTTITRMIEECLSKSGYAYFTNRSGANMDTGITGEFILNSSFHGRCRYKYALIECDELAFSAVAKAVDPNYIVVSNIFRDQLDRYGEISHTLKSILAGIQHSPHATLCINADCSLTTSITNEVSNPVLFYGLEDTIYKNQAKEISDAPYCIKCGTAYQYEFITYGHLGKYICPNCGYHRPPLHVAVENIQSCAPEFSKVTLRIQDSSFPVTINLPGGYNIYNAAATACLGNALNLSNDIIIKSLQQFECGFGRMEKFTINNKNIRMILIKNPAGANQVLNYLCNIKQPSLFIIGLNDNYADGTDISWIWDVDFERLHSMQNYLEEIIVTGTRCDDMAVRLKYADIPTTKIKKITDYAGLMEYILNQTHDVYIMPTYTAMLTLREKISRDYCVKDLWK
ncbi:MurT ligase domain-containing protein [Lachnospiraceae bacterium LCP25S3_G4]